MNYQYAIVAALMLAGCSGNPLNNGIDDGTGGGGTGGGGGGTTVNTIPAVLANNLRSIKFDAKTDTLIVDMPLDGSGEVTTYKRNKKLDVPGYRAFSQQDDPLDRLFVAMTAESKDGSVEAAAVSDGGQFNRFLAGGYYARREGGAPKPTGGLISYAGNYAGVTNLSSNGKGLLPIPAGTPGEVVPGDAAQTQGKVFMNVDFKDGGNGKVNGTIYDRKFVGPGGRLEPLALIISDIDDNGEYLGDVEFDGNATDGKQGDYGGIIGGKDGAATAGIVRLTNIFDKDDPREAVTKTFDAEVGVFVLPRCNQSNAPKICKTVNK